MTLPMLVAGFLVFARLAGLLMTLPGLSSSAVPAYARLAAALPLTVVLYPVVADLEIPRTVGALLAAVMGEAFLGAAMGASVGLLYGALAMGMEIVGTKMGFNLAAMLDPLTHAQQGALASLAGWLGTGVFLVTNTHLRCITALADSLRMLPPGTAAHPLRVGTVLVEIVGAVTTTSVQLAGPLLAFVFLVNLGILVLGRMAPNLQLFFGVGTSLTVVAGLLLLTAALPVLLTQYARTLATAPTWIEAIVRAAGGG